MAINSDIVISAKHAQHKNAADWNSRSFWADFGVMKSSVLYIYVA